MPNLRPSAREEEGGVMQARSALVDVLRRAFGRVDAELAIPALGWAESIVSALEEYFMTKREDASVGTLINRGPGHDPVFDSATCKHERGVVWQYKQHSWTIEAQECGACWHSRWRAPTMGTGEWSEWKLAERPMSAIKIGEWSDGGKVVSSLGPSATPEPASYAAKVVEEKNWTLAVEAIATVRAIRKIVQVNHNEKVEDAVARKIDSLDTAVRDLVHEQDNFTRDLQAVLGGSPTKLVETAKTLMKSLSDTRRVLAARHDEDTVDAARRVLASFASQPETT
jgi:hypothetical protein